jgi:hypothetical protein
MPATMGIDADCPAAAAIKGDTMHAVNPGLTGGLAKEMAALLENSTVVIWGGDVQSYGNHAALLDK